MGFTFSHPALILPFRYLSRSYYSFTGLVIGSMIPDLEYFIRLDTKSTYSHTLFGLFWFDMPLAVIVALFYHQIIRDNLINNLPDFLKIRLQRFQYNDWFAYLKKKWIIVIASVLIGSLTHFFWDSFTSYSGYFVQMYLVMISKLNVMGIEIRTYKIIKYMSSFIGLVLIVYQLFKLPVSEKQNFKKEKYYWVLYFTLFVLNLLVILLFSDMDEFSFNGFVKKNISAALFSIVVVSLYYKARSEN